MNPKLANTHEKAIVKHKKVPNFAKNWSWQKKSGILATTLVIIPLNTLIPKSPKASVILSYVLPEAIS